MKVKIKNGECPDYITIDKVYKVFDDEIYPEEDLVIIVCDYGLPLTIFLPSCPHLKSWQV